MAREMTLYEFDLKECLPPFMLEDPFVVALADISSHYARESLDGFDRLPFWAYIDSLSEDECDNAAWEMDLDYYVSTASLAEKRSYIKNGLKIKALRGTKWSVETLIKLYFGNGWVEEWHEYNGAPFTFRAFTENDNPDELAAERLRAALRYSKNARSVLEGIYHFKREKTRTLEIHPLSQWNEGPLTHIECGTWPWYKWDSRRIRMMVNAIPEIFSGSPSHMICSENTYGHQLKARTVSFVKEKVSRFFIGETDHPTCSQSLYSIDGKLTEVIA